MTFGKSLYVTEDGAPYIKKIDFSIEDKKVSGWVGVLGKGDASLVSNAGFSIIQSNRVIEGWPKGYNYPTKYLATKKEEPITW